jgi:hypothetical protein
VLQGLVAAELDQHFRERVEETLALVVVDEVAPLQLTEQSELPTRAGAQVAQETVAETLLRVRRVVQAL